MPIPKDQRVSFRRPCPICGHMDWCYFTPDSSLVVCMRVSSGAIKGTCNSGYLHKVGNRPYVVPRAPEPVLPAADRGFRHRTYRALLQQLSLSDAHRQQLIERGFDKEAIVRRRYRTLPPTNRAGLVRRVRERTGDMPTGVPGFYQKEGRKGPYWTLHGSPGLLIPVVDVEGYIAGMKIRVDKPGAGGKYRWLSSAELPEGTSPGAPLHVSKPPQQTSADVYVTEGPLKADRAAESLGATVIAVPGVGTWREVPSLLLRLKPVRVVIAYDMDIFTNANVERHAADLVDALQSLQVYREDIDAEVPLSVWWARWDGGKAKGIDDALQGGVELSYRRL